MTDIRELVCPFCHENTFHLYKSVSEGSDKKFIVACDCGFGGWVSDSPNGAIENGILAIESEECRNALREGDFV